MSTAFPWSSDLDRFLAMAFASYLANPGELQSWRQQFNSRRSTPACADENDLAAFCDYLIEQGQLTQWQCKMLLLGKYRGFFVEHFKLLEPIDETGSWKVFSAEDRHTKRLVRLRIKPLGGGNVECEIDES
jgi:hypothetical protein